MQKGFHERLVTCITRNQDPRSRSRIENMALWDELNVELGAKVCAHYSVFSLQQPP